jgi:xanthine dehydrogenase small subunit
MRNKITFYLNGEKHRLGPKEASMMLSDYLRYEKCLTGTKVVCAEGDCGACSVLRYNPNDPNSKIYQTFNSCITPVANLDGCSIITVEALKEADRFHEAQKTMIESHGSQCGFCTPGFVMALGGLVEKKLENGDASINEQEAKNYMTGNLCRCTGYGPIIDAAVSVDLKKETPLSKRYFNSEQEADLKDCYQNDLLLEDEDYLYFAPTKVKDALDFIENNPDAKIVASATDLGVVHNKRRINLTKLISLSHINDFFRLEEKDGEIYVGANVSLSQLRHFVRDKIEEFAKYLDVFASPQIKHIATLIGNVATASPIGDTPTPLLALEANVHVIGKGGEKIVPISDFFLDYRKINIQKGELIAGISFKVPSKNTSLRFYKNSNRKDLDISAVNFCMKIEWDKDNVAKNCVIAAGGVAATPLRMKNTEKLLVGNKVDANLIANCSQEIHKEFNPISDLRASASYRRLVVENYFKRFFSEIREVTI